MTKFLAMRKLGALRPIDEAGIEALSHVGEGEIIQVSYSRPRSLKMHRMFWALMTIVWSNLDHGRYPTVENLVAAVKISTGHRELIVLPGGAEVYVPKSISFATSSPLKGLIRAGSPSSVTWTGTPLSSVPVEPVHVSSISSQRLRWSWPKQRRSTR